MNYKQFLFLLCAIIFLNSCSKSNQCECETPFVLGNYYQRGDVVSNKGSCWMLRTDAGAGGYFNSSSSEPKDTFPTTQDYWIKICEK